MMLICALISIDQQNILWAFYIQDIILIRHDTRHTTAGNNIAIVYILKKYFHQDGTFYLLIKLFLNLLNTTWSIIHFKININYYDQGCCGQDYDFCYGQMVMCGLFDLCT